MPITVNDTITKTYGGRDWVITPSDSGYTMDGTAYRTLTGVVKTIMGNDYTNRVVVRQFLGLPEYDGPRRARTGTPGDMVCGQPYEVKGKCKSEGCYEPADCSHGFCSNHCHRHEIGAYASRKYPRTSDLHIGVEIEVNYPCSDTFRRGVGIECHRDGSLGNYGAEYKLLAKATNIVQEASELVQELWKRRARVDRKCGIHVHLDARQLSDARRMELMTWLKATQEVWFGMMPPSRRSSHYVQRIDDPRYATHYTWANVTSYNTVEIRLHGGTLNPYKVAGWLTAMIHIQAKANDASYVFPSTGDAEADFWAFFADCPVSGKEYLATRKANGGVIRDRAYNHVEE